MVEAKKAQDFTAAKTKESHVTFGSVVDFFGNVKAELKKIDWTSPEELKTYTKIVVGTTFALGLGIYFLDVIIQGVLTGLGSIVRFIGG